MTTLAAAAGAVVSPGQGVYARGAYTGVHPAGVKVPPMSTALAPAVASASARSGFRPSGVPARRTDGTRRPFSDLLSAAAAMVPPRPRCGPDGPAAQPEVHESGARPERCRDVGALLKAAAATVRPAAGSRSRPAAIAPAGGAALPERRCLEQSAPAAQDAPSEAAAEPPVAGWTTGTLALLRAAAELCGGRVSDDLPDPADRGRAFARRLARAGRVAGSRFDGRVLTVASSRSPQA